MSSPGKVLVAGGYLVLDPKQIGLVIALSARIYAIVERDNFPSQISVITVCSPQFTESEWRYQVTTSSPPNEIEIKDLYKPQLSLTKMKNAGITKSLHQISPFVCIGIPLARFCAQRKDNYLCR